MRTSHSLLVLALATPFAFLACSEGVSPPVGTGGTSSGGAASGGASASGGVSSGGTSTGGASSGGAASGGAASGGAASGGAASGGAASGGAASGGAASGGAASGGTSGGEFTLSSDGLAEGATFAEENTCAGGGGQGNFGHSLPFEWSGAPAGTNFYALVMLDTTLVGQNNPLGYHSAFWNLPASVTNLPAGFGTADLQGANTINGGYLGPCPGGTEHNYTFTLYALEEEITLGTTLNAAFITSLEAAAIDTATPLSGKSAAQM